MSHSTGMAVAILFPVSHHICCMSVSSLLIHLIYLATQHCPLTPILQPLTRHPRPCNGFMGPRSSLEGAEAGGVIGEQHVYPDSPRGCIPSPYAIGFTSRGDGMDQGMELIRERIFGYCMLKLYWHWERIDSNCLTFTFFLSYLINCIMKDVPVCVI